MTSAIGRRLVACLLNISEARERDVVERVAHAAITHQHGDYIKITVAPSLGSLYLSAQLYENNQR